MELAHLTFAPPDAERLMLLIHGYGSDPHDLSRVVPYVDPDGRFIVVAPQAPFQVPGRDGYRWYMSDESGHEPEMFHASLDALSQLLTESCRLHGVDRERSVVAGFSQGGSLAYALAFGRGKEPRPAGLVAMSTFLVYVKGLVYEWDAPDLPPVLVQHGVDDQSAPVHRLRRTVARLRERGVSVVNREYPMAHEVSLASLQDQASWLASVIAGERPSEPSPLPLHEDLDGPVRRLGDADLDDAVQSAERPVAVQFWAAWSERCRIAAPAIDEIARARTGELDVAAVDVEDAPDLAERYGIEEVPTVLLFVDGQETRRVVGVTDRQELEAALGLVVTP